MTKNVVYLDAHKKRATLNKVQNIVDDLIENILKNIVDDLEIETREKAQEFFTFLQTVEEEAESMLENGVITDYKISPDEEQNTLNITLQPCRAIEKIKFNTEITEDEDN